MWETKRFILKKLTSQDANDEYLAWFHDKEIQKFITTKAKTVSELGSFINHCNTNKLILLLGIFTKNEEKHIGNIKYEFLNKTYNEATMGIMIGIEQWRNKGVGTEVIQQSIKDLSKLYNTETIGLGVSINNVAAIQVYKKLGFKMTKVHQDYPNSIIMILTLKN